jgi:Phosphate-selective porin O and P
MTELAAESRPTFVHALLMTSLMAPLFVPTSPARADIEGLAIHGFASVYYTDTTQQNAPSGNSGFKLDNLDLYIAPSLTDRVRALMEDVVEFDDWTAPGETNGQPSVDIERLQIGYLFSDDLTVWAGRFHTPFGYWNTAYHHGAQLQPTVMRPQFLAFEDHGGILPSHTNGLWATGHATFGPGRFTYDAFLGNGSRIVDGIIDMQNAGNVDAHTALGTRLGYEFLGGALDSLWFGVHAFSEEMDNFIDGVRTAQTDVRMIGAFSHWTPGDWELMAEYYQFNNRPHDNTGPSHSSNAWYVEADYTWHGLLTPLARFEQDALNQEDGVFQFLLGGKSYKRALVGVRYDLTPQTAIKVDANHTDMNRDGGKSYNEAHVQVAIRF